MSEKVFLEKGNIKLIGDERDIMVPHRLQMQVVHWCKDHGINAILNYRGTTERWLVQETFKVDLWSISDDQQRVIFALKWA